MMPVILMLTWWANGHVEFTTQRFVDEAACERMAAQFIAFGWPGYKPENPHYPKYKCIRE